MNDFNHHDCPAQMSYADQKELARQMRELHGYDYAERQAKHDEMWAEARRWLIAIVFAVIAGASLWGLLAFMAREAGWQARGDWTRVAGEWPADMPESTQLWFKNLASQNGWCCNTADGHPAGWEKRGDHYWALYNGEWREVPEDAIITGKGNLTGGAVVFLDPRGNIRCFVPGPEG